jgi:hypothetical protein
VLRQLKNPKNIEVYGRICSNTSVGPSLKACVLARFDWFSTPVARTLQYNPPAIGARIPHIAVPQSGPTAAERCVTL